jgi:hypothetical protein
MRVPITRSDVMNDSPAERPTIKVLLIHTQPPHRSKVVDLLDLDAHLALGYLFVVRDPFTMDAWRAWRRANPEAA